MNSVNIFNSVNSVNSVNRFNSVNSVNSYSAVLPPSPMVFSLFVLTSGGVEGLLKTELTELKSIIPGIRDRIEGFDFQGSIYSSDSYQLVFQDPMHRLS